MVVCLYVCFVFFFFKQKTAYEMRISDWSSDVCSSDLGRARPRRRAARSSCVRVHRRVRRDAGVRRRSTTDERSHGQTRHCRRNRRAGRGRRSEEHTSELQSQMRNSYAGFCLKKNTLTEIHQQVTPALINKEKKPRRN